MSEPRGSFDLSLLCVVLQHQLKEAADFPFQGRLSLSLPDCCVWGEAFAATFPSLKGRLGAPQTVGCSRQHHNSQAHSLTEVQF